MTNLIAKHGGYKNLKSFQMAEIVYDFTVEFCNCHLPNMSNKTHRSYRTYDQMVQAARSGKQNIAEGSSTSGTSKQSELRLVTVARASFDELAEDYKDFLRQNNFKLWAKDDARSVEIRKLAYGSNKSYATYKTYMHNAEAAANCAICLINQTNYLLDRQLRALESDMVQRGDFPDRYKEARKKQILDDGPPIDDFFKEIGLRRTKDGRVVKVNDPD